MGRGGQPPRSRRWPSDAHGRRRGRRAHRGRRGTGRQSCRKGIGSDAASHDGCNEPRSTANGVLTAELCRDEQERAVRYCEELKQAAASSWRSVTERFATGGRDEVRFWCLQVIQEVRITNRMIDMDDAGVGTELTSTQRTMPMRVAGAGPIRQAFARRTGGS